MDEARLARLLRSVAANVRRLRGQREMTQEALAERADLSLRYLQRIEAGGVHMGIGVLVAMAEALDVAPGDLLRPAKLPPVKSGRPRKAPRE